MKNTTDYFKTASEPEVNNTSQLIDYIDGAKDWLDKARTEYSQANPLGGEMKLNLAQAEIKYAWELSRSNYVSDTMKPVQKPERKFNPILPVAASIIIIVGFGWWLAAGLHMVKTGPELTGKPNLEVKEKLTDTVRNQNTIVAQEPLPASNQTTTGQLALENKIEPVKTEPFTSANTGDRTDQNKQSPVTTTLSNQTRVKDNPAGQPNLQPVSKLVIDEDALTKEASHSLRNGK
jgi:hypothetical protein